MIVGLHGMNDYANAFHLAGPWWAAQGVTTYAYDQRGFGRSPQRGVWGGAELMAEDLRTVTALVRQRHPHALIVVAGDQHGRGGGDRGLRLAAAAGGAPAGAAGARRSGAGRRQPLAYKTAAVDRRPQLRGRGARAAGASCSSRSGPPTTSRS